MATPYGAIASSTSGGYVYPQNFIGPLRPNSTRVGQTATQGVLGDSTYAAPSTSYSAPPPAAPNGADLATQAAQRQYQDQLSAANTNYDQYSATLKDQLGGLNTQKGNLLDQIGSTYGGLYQTAQDTLTKNVGALTSRKGDVNQQYDTSRQNVGRQFADAQRINRQAARAGGVLNSTYYGDLQSGAGRQAEQNIGGLNTEEASKIDAIGQAITNQTTDTNTKVNQLHQEEGNAKNDILSKYQDQANQVNTLLRFNDRGRLDALNQIQGQLKSALDTIGQTFNSYRNYAATTQQTYANSFQTDPFAGQVGQALSQNTAATQAYTPMPDILKTALAHNNYYRQATTDAIPASATGMPFGPVSPQVYGEFNNYRKRNLDAGN